MVDYERIRAELTMARAEVEPAGVPLIDYAFTLLDRLRDSCNTAQMILRQRQPR